MTNKNYTQIEEQCSKKQKTTPKHDCGDQACTGAESCPHKSAVADASIDDNEDTASEEVELKYIDSSKCLQKSDKKALKKREKKVEEKLVEKKGLVDKVTLQLEDTEQGVYHKTLTDGKYTVRLNREIKCHIRDNEFTIASIYRGPQFVGTKLEQVGCV